MCFHQNSFRLFLVQKCSPWWVTLFVHTQDGRSGVIQFHICVYIKKNYFYMNLGLDIVVYISLTPLFFLKFCLNKYENLPPLFPISCIIAYEHLPHYGNKFSTQKRRKDFFPLGVITLCWKHIPWWILNCCRKLPIRGSQRWAAQIKSNAESDNAFHQEKKDE